MPVTQVEGMLDLAPRTSVSLSGVPLVGTPYNVYGNAAANFSEVSVTQTDGWLDFITTPTTTSGTGVVKAIGVSRPLASVFNFTATTFAYGGVRMKCRITGTTLPLVCAHDDRAANKPNVAANQQIIVAGSDVPGGVVAGTEYYIEWAIDMVNRKWLRRVNGVRLSDIPFANTGWDDALKAQAVGICYGSTVAAVIPGSTQIGYSIRDIYMGEKVGAETTDWLGAQIVAPIPLKSVTGPWTPSSGTLLDVLSTRITDNSNATTPSVTTDAAAGAATLQLDAPSLPGKINAIQVSVGGRRTTPSLGGMDAWVIDGGSQSAHSVRNLDATFTYANSVYVAGKSPDGSNWDKAKLDSITIKLQPSG